MKAFPLCAAWRRHRRAAIAALLAPFFADPALASPMQYEATVVTDIKLAGTLYHNAAVTLDFLGDTADIAAAVDGAGHVIASANCPGGAPFHWLAKGTATVTIQSQGKRTLAHFLPNQVMVAADACNGGIGFASFTGPAGMEPAYPLSFTLGTAMAFAETAAQPLATPVHTSGNAWSCIGFPPTNVGTNGQGNGLCYAPEAYPLHTDLGDVLFYMPYTTINVTDGSLIGNHTGSHLRGTFSIMVPPGG